jgi:hypothetical protein
MRIYTRNNFRRPGLCIAQAVATAMGLFANTQAVCTSFKQEVMCGIHAFGTTVTRGGTGADTFKAALYLASATYNASTTAYSTTGEVTGTGYTAGGVTVTNANQPATSGTTAYWTPSANFVWTGATLSTAFDAVLIYNSTQSNKAVAVYTFGSQTITAGTLTLTMPTNDATNGLLRLA